MTPAPAPTVNGSTPTIATASTGETISTGHPNWDTFISIVDSLIPFLLAGASPFIKNAGSQAIIAAETPVAQALLAALSKL